jgi:hypothetical protein
MIWLLSGIGHVPTLSVRSDVWDHVESYTICMLLAHSLKITFTSSLKLIISFLVSTYYSLLPSLDSHSSLVRVGTLLFLFLLCCISSLRPRGLLHNPTIPGRNLVTGVVIARTPPYVQLPTDALTRARIFLTHFSRDPS